MLFSQRTFFTTVMTAASSTIALAKPAPLPPFSSINNVTHPDLSLTTKFFSFDPELSAFLDNPPEPITVFLPTDQTYTQKYFQPLVLDDPDYNHANLQYVIVCGIHTQKDLQKQDKTFLTTILKNPKYTNVTGGAVIEVTSDKKQLSTSSGIADKANFTQDEIPFKNGIAHVLDRLLVTPINASITGSILKFDSLAKITAPGTIPQIDVERANDVTIFAPSNGALAKYKADHNGAEPTPQAYQGLVVQGGQVHYSTTLNNKYTQLKTVGGKSITVTQEKDGRLLVNYAKVIQPDILTSNGVIHIIDQVLV